jgi:hypothetical protein
MKNSFLWNYANGVNINNGDAVYMDALQNFTYDCAVAGLKLIKPLPDDVFELFVIDSNNPNDSHIKTRQYGQVGLDFLGLKPEDYLVYATYIADLIIAKKKRIKDALLQ